MGSVSSEEASEERSGSYSLSADVSESESSTDLSGGASSSSAFSPFAAGSPASFTPAFSFPLIGGEGVPVWDGKSQKLGFDSSEIKMMKEKFAKLLLGEDMSGGGKGVCSALAISNSITNLSAAVFGELWRLEPIAPQKKSMWRREMEWLLSISDSIVEFHPSIRHFPGGGTYEVMAARLRSDICMNMPALKKLDVMLISILDGFRETEFSYSDRGIVMDDCDRYPITTSGRPSVRQEEKWWLPCPKVPGNGLSEDARKRLQQCRDCANQILKAALAINSNVLAEMDIPAAYIETLPKNGRDCLGDTIYRHINADQFSPECILDCLDLSSEHRTADVANRIEAALHVWKMKEKKQMLWGGMVMGFVADGERSQFLAKRAETLLHILKIRFPCLPQTALDMTKIQYNKDVGQSILESYSRVMESLAFNIIARIDDVLYVDDATRCSSAEAMSNFNRGGFNGLPIQKKMCPSPFSIEHRPYMSSAFATPTLCSSPSSPISPRVITPQKNTKSSSLKHEKVLGANLDNPWASGKVPGDKSDLD